MAKLVPVNLSVEDAHLAAGLPVPDDSDMPPAPAASELSNWSQESYSMDVNAAASLGFPVGSVSASYHQQAFLFGVQRWKDVTKNGHSFRYGVSLRAIVRVYDIKAGGALTLPVISAKVDLEGARATAQLLVRGYKGDDLAKDLPAWQSFGVDAYASYMKSISTMQEVILGSSDKIQPELLATTLLDPAIPPPGAAVGTVYALHAIDDGATLAHALSKFGSRDPDVRTIIRMVYEARIGADDTLKPSEDARQAARSELIGLHLRNGWFQT